MGKSIVDATNLSATGMRRRTALVGAVGGIAVGVIALDVGRSRGSQAAAISPEQFAKRGDGDDAAPMIQAAIDHAAAAGGGIVRLTPGKTYILRAIAPGSDVTSPTYRASLAIPAGAANITIDLNGAVLKQEGDAFTFGTAYRLFNDKVMEQSRRPLASTPRAGDKSIAVADPAAFPTGSRVMLVSGNISRNAYIPVAEMFKVVGQSGGAIELDRPVRKDHGLAHGNAVGVINVTRHSASNIAIKGPGLIVNHLRRAGNLVQIFGFTMSQVSFEGMGGFLVSGHDLVVEDCLATIVTNPASSLRPYAIAFDTGSSGIRVTNLKATGDNFCYIHLHEGLSDVLLSGVQLHNTTRFVPDWISPAALSIMGLSWNIHVENIRIVNNPQGPGIVCRASNVMHGGNNALVLDGVVLEGVFRNRALIIEDQDVVTVRNLDMRNVTSPAQGAAVRLAGARHDVAGPGYR
jgi:hypothetical protein